MEMSIIVCHFQLNYVLLSKIFSNNLNNFYDDDDDDDDDDEHVY